MTVRFDTVRIEIAESFPVNSIFRTAVGVPGHSDDEALAILRLLKGALSAPVDIELDWVERSTYKPLVEGGEVIGPRSETGASTLSLFTSGTTGAPKRICRSLGGEAVHRAGRGSSEDIWLLTYAPFRWAGISVMLHTLANGCSIVVPDDNGPAALCRAMIEGEVSHVSLTPSLLRKMQVFGLEDQLASAPLRQITFGGEAADGPILATARRLWPKARVTHVYATTELGDVLAVSDGLPGIPARKVEDNPRFAFTERGEMIVGGCYTSDLWEKAGDRYLFKGRKEEIINVGGNKISPNEVESAALSVPHVMWARAFAVPSPIIGFAVGLEYFGEIEPLKVREVLREVLPKVALPVVIRRVQEVVTTDAMKTQRCATL